MNMWILFPRSYRRISSIIADFCGTGSICKLEIMTDLLITQMSRIRFLVRIWMILSQRVISKSQKRSPKITGHLILAKKLRAGNGSRRNEQGSNHHADLPELQSLEAKVFQCR